MAQLSRNEMVMVPVLENLLSEIRDWTITLGRDQSVGSIGSHTTRTGSAVNAPVPAIFQLRTPPASRSVSYAKAAAPIGLHFQHY